MTIRMDPAAGLLQNRRQHRPCRLLNQRLYRRFDNCVEHSAMRIRSAIGARWQTQRAQYAIPALRSAIVIYDDASCSESDLGARHPGTSKNLLAQASGASGIGPDLGSGQSNAARDFVDNGKHRLSSAGFVTRLSRQPVTKGCY